MLTDSLITRRVRRMNCSLSCLRRLFGIFSLGITNLSLGGTFSPISCISPSTTHHSDLSSTFFIVAVWNLFLLLAGDEEPVSDPIDRSWWAVDRKHRCKYWNRFASESMETVAGLWIWFYADRAAKIAQMDARCLVHFTQFKMRRLCCNPTRKGLAVGHIWARWS